MNPHWMVIYPKQHLLNPNKTRSIILINHAILTNNWAEINIASNDVTGVCIYGDFSMIDIFNIYNDRANNDSLKVLKGIMRGRGGRNKARNRLREKEGVIWLGDFNMHHPLWDEERNTHLFTRAALEVVQTLLNMISIYDMHMALAKDILMLEACMTKNYTRVDNVFCSENLQDRFILCDTYPQWRPQKTDHIISIMDIEPEKMVHEEKYSYKLTDWTIFKRTLEADLTDIQIVDELTSKEECLDQITKLDTAIKGAIKEHVPLSKMSSYMKRWWMKDLTDLKKQKE